MTEAKSPKASSDCDGSPSQESSVGSDEEAVEMMVTARAKRATAGNRLSLLLDKEAKDDIDLLFADDDAEEEDVEFEDQDEDASDAELESSSEDEDQGPTKDGEEEMTGEQELQKQDRLDRKKRKAQGVFNRPGALRKRVKIDISIGGASDAQSTPAPRQKKKSERLSWVPTAADAPTRISSRKQTVKNREFVHKRLVDSEQQRVKIMKQMEAAQKRKDAQKIKPMTQAERMEEAAKIERKNAKSLNRWEEAEKKRAEEQKAKLEALHNRQLTGPVISLWSGIARWINGKVFQNGVREIRDAGHREQPALAVRAKNDMVTHQQYPQTEHRPTQDTIMTDVANTQPTPEAIVDTQEGPSDSSKPAAYTSQPSRPHELLDGIQAYASQPAEVKQPEFTGTADDGFQPAHSAATPKVYTNEPASLPNLPKPVVPIDEYSSRNLVALRNIDANASKGPELQDSPLLKKQKVKLQKPAPAFCAITSQPARFRDPKTGLPYADTHAYKEIQRLYNGGSRWSNLLDCYVGSATVVARDVPERFSKRSEQ